VQVSRLGPPAESRLGEGGKRPRVVVETCDVAADATPQPHDVQEMQVGVLLGLHGSVE
jgi:hypothetical protein